MKIVLATAYAINPFKGSEDGMGWNFTLQIARFQKVIVITRENNQKDIEKYIRENPNSLYENIRFLYFDLPYWLRFWKKGSRGAMLYYILWQRGIVFFIKNKNIRFDIVHNVNFHNDWTPSFLWKLNKPLVWGPIGHHPRIPKQFLNKNNIMEIIRDRTRWIVKKYFWNCSFMLRNTIRKADHILCMNNAVPLVLKLKKDFSIMPSVASQDFGWDENKERDNSFRVVSAGRFVSLKGFDLTINAFANFYNSLNDQSKLKCELIIIGDGPLGNQMKLLVKQFGMEDKIKFINWMERGELMKLFKSANVFLFPSHEGAGMVVAEALSFGLPVVCLDNEGPGQFITSKTGFKIKEKTYKDTVQKLADALGCIFENPSPLIMRNEARKHFLKHFIWDKRGEDLKIIYEKVCQKHSE